MGTWGREGRGREGIAEERGKGGRKGDGRGGEGKKEGKGDCLLFI